MVCRHTLVADGSVGSDDRLLHLRALVLGDQSGSDIETRDGALLGEVEAQKLGVVVDDLGVGKDKADETLITTLEALDGLNTVASLSGNVALLVLGGGLAESAALVLVAVLLTLGVTAL